MKAIILNGSARGLKGVTGRLVKALVNGLSEGGAEVKQFQLQGLDISPCTACLSCMHKTAGECVIKDDMKTIYKGLKTSDLLIMATPVYTDNMSAQLKTAMDRCLCCLQPFLIKDRSGRIRHPYFWRMPSKMLLLSTSGFPEIETFFPLTATFRAQAANLGAEAIGEICIPGSIGIQMEPERLEPHLKLLQEFGRILATTGQIDKAILKALNIPPMGIEEYLTAAARYEAWCKRGV